MKFLSSITALALVFVLILPSTVFAQVLLVSPLQQYNKGILAEDVKCKLGFQLVIKKEYNSPACARPETAKKLVERGWAYEYSKKLSNTNLTIAIANQTLSHRIIDGMQYNFFPPGVGGIANVAGYTDPYCKNGYGNYTVMGLIGYTEYSNPNVQTGNNVTSQHADKSNNTLVLVKSNGNVVVFYCMTEASIHTVP